MDRRVLFDRHLGQWETGPRTSAVIMTTNIQTIGTITGMARTNASK